jgi:hypothetical protein
LFTRARSRVSMAICFKRVWTRVPAPAAIPKHRSASRVRAEMARA